MMQTGDTVLAEAIIYTMDLMAVLIFRYLLQEDFIIVLNRDARFCVFTDNIQKFYLDVLATGKFL